MCSAKYGTIVAEMNPRRKPTPTFFPSPPFSEDRFLKSPVGVPFHLQLHRCTSSTNHTELINLALPQPEKLLTVAPGSIGVNTPRNFGQQRKRIRK